MRPRPAALVALWSMKSRRVDFGIFYSSKLFSAHRGLETGFFDYSTRCSQSP
jgi:hypothetical protein